MRVITFMPDLIPEFTNRYQNMLPEKNDIKEISNFKKYFDDRAGECTDGIYPTVTIRQMMWALKMKPIQRQRWETCFDRRDV